jgi:alpha-L-fucosidase 2
MNRLPAKGRLLFGCGAWLALAGTAVSPFISTGQVSNPAPVEQAAFKPVPDREGAPLPADATVTGKAQPPESAMSWWYRSPATKFWEGLPLGNGRFAAMVYGRVRDEIIPFNDQTLWTGQPYDPVNPNGLKSLPEIRRLALAEKFAEATDLATNLLSYPVPNVQTYQAMARLHVRFEGHDTVEDYRRELDLDSAIARVTYRIGDAHFTREVFASYPDQIVVMRVTCDRPGRITLNASLSSLHKSAVGRLAGPGTLLLEGGVNEPNAKIPSRMKWQGRIRVQAQGGTMRNVSDASGQSVRVEKADAVTILLAGATNYKDWDELGADPDARCAGYLEKAGPRSFAELKKRHLDDFQPLFRACALDLGTNAAVSQDTTARTEQLRKGGTDPQFTAQYFQYGRYLLLAGSRPGTLAFNNHNMWLDDLQGRWRGRWTLNINLQECYWPAESANLAETADALLAFTEKLAASGRRTAQELYGCRGWCAHHGTDIWMNTTFTDGTTWGMTPLMGAWLLQSLWEHYRFDPDPKYLARIYPLLKGAAEFGVDYLVEEPKHKWLVTCPSASPENSFLLTDHRANALCAGPALDSELLRDLFHECIEASEKLGVDGDLRGQLQAVLLRLPPLQIGPQGQLLEWLEDYPEAEVQHRHISHLYAAYPSDQITLRGAPELAAAVRRTLERRGDNLGWSAAWKINLYARLGDAASAYRVLHQMETEISIHPSRDDSDRVPSMEGNQGIQAWTAGLVEMLVQSHTGEIELLPALPKEWLAGSARGLRARGGVTVDLAWKEWKLSSATLQTKYAGPCRLRSAVPVKVRQGNQEIAGRRLDTQTLEFSAEANGVYSITPQE